MKLLSNSLFEDGGRQGWKAVSVCNICSVKQTGTVWGREDLSERRQQWKEVSSEFEKQCGVPQDNVLGSLLLLLRTNNITNSTLYNQVQLFGYDTVLCLTGVPKLVALFNFDLNILN